MTHRSALSKLTVKNNSNAASAFTLVELLVVIAVIAILAALSLPVLSRAKARAQRTVCLNNLHQISLGVLMYSGDSHDATPSPGGTNEVALYSGFKALMKSYVGLNGTSSPQDTLFACPADAFYPSDITTNGPYPPQYVHESLHDQPIFDFSSYAFNGGDNATRPLQLLTNIVVTRPGLTGVKMSSVRHPGRTLLVTEASALWPWSWHDPSPPVQFNDAKSVVSFVDGHVGYIKIYWQSTHPVGTISYAALYDPPASYDYQWSPN